LRLTAEDLLKEELIDLVVAEPQGGATLITIKRPRF
jgi:acetyl-CoA carboxylase alpha subunit